MMFDFKTIVFLKNSYKRRRSPRAAGKAVLFIRFCEAKTEAVQDRERHTARKSKQTVSRPAGRKAQFRLTFIKRAAP